MYERREREMVKHRNGSCRDPGGAMQQARGKCNKCGGGDGGGGGGGEGVREVVFWMLLETPPPPPPSPSPPPPFPVPLPFRVPSSATERKTRKKGENTFHRCLNKWKEGRGEERQRQREGKVDVGKHSRRQRCVHTVVEILAAVWQQQQVIIPRPPCLSLLSPPLTSPLSSCLSTHSFLPSPLPFYFFIS